MTDSLWSPGRRALTTGLVSTVTLVAFEALAVSTAMPVVARELGGIELYGWVFAAFFLGSLIGIVVAGGIIDRGGLVRPFLAGLGLFAAGLLVGGLAPSMMVLVAARFVQGVGAGALPPIAYVAIGRTLPEALRPRMFATLSTAWVVPGLVGPAVAGYVADEINWRLVFVGLIPILALAGALTVTGLGAAASHARLAPDAAEHAAAEASLRRLPLALVVAAGAGLVVAGLSAAQPVLLVGGVAVGLLLAVPSFARLTPPGTLVAAEGLPAAVLLRGLLTFAFFAADAYVPLALVEVRGTSPTEAGLALTAATLSWTGGAWVQARWLGSLGTRMFVRAGFAIVTIGVLGFTAVLWDAVPIPLAVVAWAVTGLGMGLSYSPLSMIVLSEARSGTEGTATSGLQLADVLGTALGTGVGGAFIAAGERAGQTALGLAWAFAIAVVVGLGGLVLTRRLHGPVTQHGMVQTLR
ncbi:MAG TPA: MFS transporter [Candidatus Limnocylindrales bacterium]